MLTPFWSRALRRAHLAKTSGRAQLSACVAVVAAVSACAPGNAAAAGVAKPRPLDNHWWLVIAAVRLSHAAERRDPMQRLSSRMTLYSKRVFLHDARVRAAFRRGAGRRGRCPAPAPPLPSIFFGDFIARRLIFDLVDEAWDAGDH